MSVAVITGAAGNVGQALINAALESGKFDRVIAADKRPVASVNPGIDAFQVDLSTPAGAQALAEHAGERVSLLVNAAGLCEPTSLDEGFSSAVGALGKIADNNLLALLLPSRALMPALIAAGESLIINVTSRDLLPAGDDQTQSAEHDLWLASQWAVNGATDAWALDLARHGVRVNGLCIGGLEGTRTAFPEPAWQRPAITHSELAQLIQQLIDSDLTGENVGFWPGRTGPLRSGRPRHRQITG